MEPKETAVIPNNEEFSRFIYAYAISWGANHFLNVMDSEQRVAFFIAIAQTYPDEWNEAITKLTAGG